MVFKWRDCMKKDLDEVLEMIVNGEISIRKASEE